MTSWRFAHSAQKITNYCQTTEPCTLRRKQNIYHLKSKGKSHAYEIPNAPRLKYWPHLQHYPKREALVWEVFSEIVSQNKKKQFLSAVLLVKAPIKNKQNTSKQVKFESSHVRIIHKPRTRDWGQYLSLDQTKRENIFMDFFKIFWLELQTWPNLYRLNKGIWLDWRKQLQKVQKRRAMCLVVIIWRRQSPNKRFTIGKSFVHPLVDSKVNSKF